MTLYLCNFLIWKINVLILSVGPQYAAFTSFKSRILSPDSRNERIFMTLYLCNFLI